MKKLLHKLANLYAAARNRMRMTFCMIMFLLSCPKLALANKRGENFLDSGFKVLIVVVIASLLLAGLYALFSDTIMPTLTTKVQDLFNYSGN